MFERLRSFLSPEVIDEPRDWEMYVAKSLEFLTNEIERAEVAKDLENFQAYEHAQRVRTRVGNLKEVIIMAAKKEAPKIIYPSYFSIDSERSYFYLPYSNNVIKAKEKLCEPSQFTPAILSSVPNLYESHPVDDKTWCLDKAIVGNIAKVLICSLPERSSQRILPQVTTPA